MNNKDVEKGIEIATKATKGFLKKYEDGIREVEKRVIQKIDEHGKLTNAILEELNRQEAKDLYNIIIQNDLANLGVNEKNVLCNCIFILMENYYQNTETQKKYYMAISKYLNVSTINDNFDYEVIENIDSKNDCMLISKSICEFLFLNSGNFDFLDNFDWLFSIIYIRKKDIEKLCSEIERIYNILGVEGILNHYTNPEDEKTYFDNLVKIEQFGAASYTAIEKDNSKIVLQCVALTARTLSEANLEHFDLNESVDYNKPIKFYRKSISIDHALTFNCEALFEECIIEYKLMGASKIIVGNESKVSFVNCKFICKELSQERTEKYFISVNSGTNNQSITFEGCAFDNCQNILICNDKTKLADAKILNCFIYYSHNIFNCEGIVDSCIIKNNEILVDNTNTENLIFSIRYYNNNLITQLEIANNLFIGLMQLSKENEFSQDNVIRIDENYSVDSCTFINLNDCIENGKIYNCEFVNCNQPVRYSNTISNCIFNNCNSPKENLINNVFDCNIDSCQFVNCAAPIIDSYSNTTFEKCSFKGIKIYEEHKDYFFVDKVLFKQRTNKYHEEIMTINNCTFDDIELNSGVLAKCEPDNKKSTIPGLFFESCTFNNLHTNRKDKIIIDKTAQIKTLFGKEMVTTVSINNCSGLESFDEGKLCCAQYEPKKIKLDGTHIGANYSEFEIEELSNSTNLKRNSLHKKTETQKNNMIFNSIVDFLNTKGGSIFAGKESDESLKNILSQFTEDDATNINDIIGFYNGSVSLKDCFGKELNGILFLKNGFYFKKHVDSQSYYMNYANIEHAYSEYIKGKDGTNIDTKSPLSLYSSSEISSLFNNISKILEL